MFCPNCGKAAEKDMAFCAFCGNPLPRMPQVETVWKVGMPCPFCGGNKLSGNHCAYCGGLLAVNAPERQIDPRKMLKNLEGRKYKSSSNSLLIDGAVYIEKVGYHTKISKLEYSEIKRVDMNNSRMYGWITFRNSGNLHKPMPAYSTDALEDNFTYLFRMKDYDEIRYVYRTFICLLEQRME